MSKASFVKIFSPLFIFLIFFGAVHAQENEYIPMGPEGTIGNTAPESTVPGNNVNQNKPATVSNTAQGPAAKGVYTPLVNLPGLDGANRTLPEYINVLFRLAVGIGALIAVVKIIVAGVKYMSSDVVFSKEEAKKDIQNSLLGLLIILSTVVVLQTINRNILNLDILQRMSPLQSVAEPAVVVETSTQQRPGDLLNPRPDPVTITQPTQEEAAAFQEKLAAPTTLLDSRQYTHAPNATIGRGPQSDIIYFMTECRAKPGGIPQTEMIRDEFGGAIIGTNAYCIRYNN